MHGTKLKIKFYVETDANHVLVDIEMFDNQ